MSYLYMASDVHGELDVLDMALTAVDLVSPGNRLVLLGDYIPHVLPGDTLETWSRRSGTALCFVKRLQEDMAGRVDVVMGNWEQALLRCVDYGRVELTRSLERWLRGLPYLIETDAQVLVHAGVDEEAGEWWRLGTSDDYLCGKYPPTFGRFEKDVVAGHVGTAHISGDEQFHGVFWDGENHYFIDGSTEESGVMPLLRYDTEGATYSYALVTRQGVGAWQSVRAAEPKGVW